MKKQLQSSYADVVSVENLLEAWSEFLRGKRHRADVQQFSLRLMDNIILLHGELANGTYQHGGYHAFNISDPKPRNIHKAVVRDRLVHHAVFRKLYPFFHTIFIADSFSCQQKKGTHRAINRFRAFHRKVSKNNTRTCWVLKCDIKKFFASVHHDVLENILASYIPNKDILRLLHTVIHSFNASKYGVGLPLGNLTSQLFVNMYMNELDQFIKHRLRARYYIRYCDDFVILSDNKNWLEECIAPIQDFLFEKLKLQLHPRKLFLGTIASGVDFLGWMHFHSHRIPRSVTKRRMMKRIGENPTPETLASYLGLLKHGNTGKLQRKVLKEYQNKKTSRSMSENIPREGKERRNQGDKRV